MAAAKMRPDGLYDVPLDTGQVVPMNLTEEQLRGMGHEIAPAAPMAPGPTPAEVIAMASLGGGAPAQAATDDPFGGLPAPGGGPPRLTPLGAVPSRGHGAPSSYAPEESAKADPGELDKSGGSGGETSAAPRATPARLIPGKDVRASYTRRPGQELPDDIKSEFESDNRPEDYQARANTIADLRNEQMTEREAHLMERRKALEIERANRAAIDQKLSAKQKLISDREQEADKLTPRTAREVWNDKSTFGRLTATIAMMLGGYLQGSQGRATNPGIDQVNEAINSEVQGERQKYEDALAKGETARNDYSKALELYGSPEAAEQDLTMRRLAIAEKMVENHGQRIGTQESLQAAEQYVGGLRQQRAEVKKALYESQHGQIMQENYVLTPDRYVGGGVGPATEKGVHQYGEDLEKSGVNEREANLGAIQDLIARVPEGELPTENTRNVVSRATRGALDFAGGYGTASGVMDSPSERRAVAGVEKIKGALRKELSGVSVNDKEQHALDQQLDGINTREGLQRFATELQRSNARRKAAIRAANNPAAVQTYEQRKGAYGLPKRVEAKPDD